MIVNRPHSIAKNTMPVSSIGTLGNFGNWIQSAKDLLALYHDCDTFLMCEDDILVSQGLAEFIAARLWPSEHCGCISLYSPSLRHYKTGSGLCRTNVMYTDVLSTHHNLVGALCLLFPRNVLQDIVSDQASIDDWRGSHTQRRDSRTSPWDRKAIDTWIGRTLVHKGYEVWNFNPGLVKHVGFISSLGNRVPIHQRGKTPSWAGEHPAFDRVFGNSVGTAYSEIKPRETACGRTSGLKVNTGSTTPAVIDWR